MGRTASGGVESDRGKRLQPVCRCVRPTPSRVRRGVDGGPPRLLEPRRSSRRGPGGHRTCPVRDRPPVGRRKRPDRAGSSASSSAGGDWPSASSSTSRPYSRPGRRAPSTGLRASGPSDHPRRRGRSRESTSGSVRSPGHAPAPSPTPPRSRNEALPSKSGGESNSARSGPTPERIDWSGFVPVPRSTLDTAAALIGRTSKSAADAVGRPVEGGILRQVTIGRRTRAFEAPEAIAASTDPERRLGIHRLTAGHRTGHRARPAWV